MYSLHMASKHKTIQKRNRTLEKNNYVWGVSESESYAVFKEVKEDVPERFILSEVHVIFRPMMMKII